MFLKVLLLFLAVGACAAVPFKRVANGKQVDNEDPRPWNVWLRKGKARLHCGGTLVSNSWVVTAASCINEQINAVVAGDHDLTLEENSEQILEIASTITHPDFNKTSMENDIALVQLATPAILTQNVGTLPLLVRGSEILEGIDENKIYDKYCRISGWGQPDFPKGAKFANRLEELVVQRVNDSDCDEAFDNRPSSMLCFEPYRRPDLSSTCEGDVGGPLVCKVRTQMHLVGVVSAWNTDEICSTGIKGATKSIDAAEWILSYVSPATTPAPTPVIEPTTAAPPATTTPTAPEQDSMVSDTMNDATKPAVDL